jgi:hypothetical protein
MRTISTVGILLIATLFAGACQVSITSAESIPKILSSGPYQPFVDLGVRREELANQPNMDTSELCKSYMYSVYAGGRPSEKVIMSGAIDRANVNVQKYYNSMNYAFPLYIKGEDYVLPELKDDLVLAAEMGAFEKVKPNSFGLTGYNAFNEGKFHQSMLLISLGIAFKEIERAYGPKNPDVVTIRNWGNRVFQASNNGRDDFKDRARELIVPRERLQLIPYGVFLLTIRRHLPPVTSYIEP